MNVKHNHIYSSCHESCNAEINVIAVLFLPVRTEINVIAVLFFPVHVLHILPENLK